MGLSRAAMVRFTTSTMLGAIVGVGALATGCGNDGPSQTFYGGPPPDDYLHGTPPDLPPRCPPAKDGANAWRIPAKYCPLCSGTVAYAVCDTPGDAYEICSCEVPCADVAGSSVGDAGEESCIGGDAGRTGASGTTHRKEVKVQTRGPDEGNPTPM